VNTYWLLPGNQQGAGGGPIPGPINHIVAVVVDGADSTVPSFTVSVTVKVHDVA
jgi:hypothetical protein